MLKLKALLQEHDLTQADLASSLKLSRPTIAQLINHSLWPKTLARHTLEHNITVWLKTYGITGKALNGIFEDDPSPAIDDSPLAIARRAGRRRATPQEPTPMLLRRQTLTPQARQAFGLCRDPFANPTSSAEVFVSPDIRYVRETLYQAVTHGAFLAIVGESGAGKSTLRKDLHARLQAESRPVVIIEPHILGMEDDDFKGKTLKSIHISEAILAALAPATKLPRGQQLRFQRVHQALKESARLGNKHVLIIEEAHALPIPTLRHLKRFFELEDGFEALLSIVLIGQTELGIKLDERNPAVREVVQRCEVITLNPLGEHLRDYLEHRFKRIGKPLGELMDEATVEALRDKLSGHKGKSAYSVLYPLAVHNVLAAALNAAAAIGAPRLSPDIIAEV